MLNVDYTSNSFYNFIVIQCYATTNHVALDLNDGVSLVKWLLVL